MDDLHKIKKGDVLVTTMTNPDMVVSMQKSAAIVTDEGGMTAHASIVSREMGIPCVVGTGEATEVLKEGMKITVDGTNGKIYEGEVAKTQLAEVKKAVEVSKVKLKLIVDLPEFAERAADAGIKAIGLTRLEGIIASSNKHPLLYEKENTLEDYTELLRQGIEKISLPFKSMWIRTSDIRTDEYSTLKGAPEKEINPMLGLHGVRFLLKHPKILQAELEAIKKVAVKYSDKKFGIMFPLVISVEEMRELKKYFNEIKTPNMQIGVMIETPAAVQIIDDLCKEEIDFISFGTNDLTQFTLGVDRGEDEVQYLYDETHPAVVAQILHVIERCKKYNVETSICGQAGSRPEMVKILFKKGIDSISINADAALKISELIKKMEDEGVKQESFKGEVEEQSNNNNDVPAQNTGLPQNNQLKNQQSAPLGVPTEIGNNQSQEKKAPFGVLPARSRNPRIVKCAECGKETRLPFMPRKNKEYFCKACFKARKKDNSQPTLPKLPERKNESKPVSVQDIQEQKQELAQEVTGIEPETTMLNPENVQVSAELHEAPEKAKDFEKEIGDISPIDNLGHIEDSAEDIVENIEDYNDNKIEDNQEIEDKIEASGERVDEEIKEEKIEENPDEGILPLNEEDYNTESSESNSKEENPSENSSKDEYEEKHDNEYAGFGNEYGGF